MLSRLRRMHHEHRFPPDLNLFTSQGRDTIRPSPSGNTSSPSSTRSVSLRNRIVITVSATFPVTSTRTSTSSNRKGAEFPSPPAPAPPAAAPPARSTLPPSPAHPSAQPKSLSWSLGSLFASHPETPPPRNQEASPGARIADPPRRILSYPPPFPHRSTNPGVIGVSAFPITLCLPNPALLRQPRASAVPPSPIYFLRIGPEDR